MNKNHPNDYEIERRLCAVVVPFTAGSSYGTGNVDREHLEGGVTRAVSCLGLRSKNHANANEVERELNAAHRRAAEWALKGTTPTDAVLRVLADVDHDGAVLGSPEARHTAAVLVLDVLGSCVNGAHAFERLSWAIGAPFLDVVGAIRTARALHASEGVNV